MHGRHICDSALSPPDSAISSPATGLADMVLDPSPPPKQPPQRASHSHSLTSSNPEKPEQPPASIPYMHQLPGVLLADELTSKTALKLLFQLVQWQMRKAEKYAEVRAAACTALCNCKFLRAARSCLHQHCSCLRGLPPALCPLCHSAGWQ
jgi:hypothetical protein